MTFSENLKRLRIKKGLSQTKLAKIAGLRQSNIVRLENGTSKPRSFTLLLLAEALRVTMDELYGDPL